MSLISLACDSSGEKYDSECFDIPASQRDCFKFGLENYKSEIRKLSAAEVSMWCDQWALGSVVRRFQGSCQDLFSTLQLIQPVHCWPEKNPVLWRVWQRWQGAIYISKHKWTENSKSAWTYQKEHAYTYTCAPFSRFKSFTCERGLGQINSHYTIVSDEGGSCLSGSQLNRKRWINSALYGAGHFWLDQEGIKSCSYQRRKSKHTPMRRHTHTHSL